VSECAEDQLYLYLYDSFGDGWNGATLSVADCDGEMIAEDITMGGGSYSMDEVCLPAGDGYTVTAGGGDWDSEITWQIGSADEPLISGSAGTVSTCGCDDSEWDLHLVDSFGDGWNGATITVEDCDGNVVQSGLAIIGWGNFSAVDACLPASDGYTITAGGGNWDSEISWTLLDSNGEVLLEGEAGTSSLCEGYEPEPEPEWNHQCDVDHTEYGAETCDLAWFDFGLDCASLESDYFWDCTGCECPGDEGGCADSDNGAVDPFGDTCEDYNDFPEWCGGYDDDDFVSEEMCCVCGGGGSDDWNHQCDVDHTEYGAETCDLAWENVKIVDWSSYYTELEKQRDYKRK
jgi:hypothetical protein